MSLGKNIQYLRLQREITQEKLAEHMGVSRQIVSKWESDETVPELTRMVELCDFFSCKLDALVRENMDKRESIYSEISVRTVKAFRMARYVVISPNPEDDALGYMRTWKETAGIEAANIIGWDFPFVTQEQQNRFGLRGYAAACVLPEGIAETCEGVQYAQQREATYAVITVYESMLSPFESIPNGYKRILEFLSANGCKTKRCDDILPCFEYEYTKDGAACMDIYVQADMLPTTAAPVTLA